MQVELIKDRKSKRNFTNKQLAEMTDVSESTISRILSRQGEPKFEDIAKLAGALGISLDELAGIARLESEEIQELRTIIAEKDVQIATYERIVNSYDKLLAEKDGGNAYLKRIIRILGFAVAILTVFLMLADASFILDFVRT